MLLNLWMPTIYEVPLNMLKEKLDIGYFFGLNNKNQTLKNGKVFLYKLNNPINI